MLSQLVTTMSAIAGSLGALALRLAPERKKLTSQGLQARYLRDLGLDRKAIAAILATTEATISTRLSELEQSTKRRGSRRKARAKR
jgi:CRP-like cAMP-binding protein